MVLLGAWCDLETEDDARRRLLTGPAEGGDGDQHAAGGSPGPAPGRFAPFRGTPVLSPGGISFRVAEFAVLADGRRIQLHDDRGFTVSAGADGWRFLTLQSLEADVRNTVLPDDAEETGDDHPWAWLAALLREQGVDTSAEQLRTLPYGVEFSPRLRAQVLAGG